VRGLIADQNNSGILAERLGDLDGAQQAYALAVEGEASMPSRGIGSGRSGESR
jgi:hypothetical protein